MHRNNTFKTTASADRPHLRLRILKETLEEPSGAPLLGNTPGNPLGEPLGVSEETSGGTSEETSGRTPGGPLEEPLGGTRRPTVGHFRTQQSLVRRRRGVEACIALPITLLTQAESKSSTTGGTHNQRTQGQKNIRLKTVRDVTQVVRGILGIQAASASRPHLRLRIPRETLEEPLEAPLGNTPGNPLGDPLGGSEETSGGPLRKPLVEPLGGPWRNL
jgi:hypothetical protein